MLIISRVICNVGVLLNEFFSGDKNILNYYYCCYYILCVEFTDLEFA